MRRPAAWALALVAGAGCYHPRPLPPLTEALPATPESAAAPSSAPLDCEAAVAAALTRHPVIRAAEAGQPVRRAAVEAAGQSPAPELRLRDDARDPGESIRVGLRFDVPVPGEGGALEEAARAEERLGAAEIDGVRAEVAAAVRKAYADLALARALRKAREDEAAIAAEGRRDAAARAEGGMATALAEQEAALQVIRAEAAVAAARATEEAAAEAVRAWTGQPAVEAGAACAQAPETDPPLAAHPAVRAAQEAAHAADAKAFAAHRAAWVWPTFFEVDWDRQPANEDDRVLLRAGVRLPWPDAKDAVADARVRQQVAESAAVETRVRTAVAQARAEWRAARAALDQLEAGQSTVTAAGALADRAGQAGADPREVLDLRTRLSAYAADLAEARHREALAAAELRRALGLP